MIARDMNERLTGPIRLDGRHAPDVLNLTSVQAGRLLKKLFWLHGAKTPNPLLDRETELVLAKLLAEGPGGCGGPEGMSGGQGCGGQEGHGAGGEARDE